MIVQAQKESSGSFSIRKEQKVELGYALYVPQDAKTPKPLIVFLHGSGEKGTDIEKVKIHGPFKYLKTHQLDAYVLAPQCRDQNWDVESLYALILKIVRENRIDRNRICLTGLSMGGWGSWKLGMAHPEMFAAIVPICGFVDLMDQDDICKLKNVPVRIFHGLRDDVVKVEYAADAYKILKDCGGDVTMTIFDDANHDAWTRVYDQPDIYQWMLAQSRPQ
jgi:predicted peptidase